MGDEPTQANREAAIYISRLTGWNGVAERLEKGWNPEPGCSEYALLEFCHRLASQPQPPADLVERDFEPCPTCGQYSHSIALKGKAKEAFMELTTMVYENPMKSWPTGYKYSQEARAAARALAAQIAALSRPTLPQSDEIGRLRTAMETIKRAAEQADDWPPSRRDETLKGILKLATNATPEKS